MVQYTDEEIRQVYESLHLLSEEDRKSKRFEFYTSSDLKIHENNDDFLTITDNTVVRK